VLYVLFVLEIQMGPTTTVTHSKYYIYKHGGNNDGSSGYIQYRTVINNVPTWTDVFDQATLCADYEMTHTRASSLQQSLKDEYVCIGKVHVVTDPFFALVCMKDKK
jgi:hypothetical protein